MSFHLAPRAVSLILLWISLGHCQYDPYGGSPFYGGPEPPPPDYFLPGVPPQPPQPYYPNNANINPFLPAGNQAQSQQQQTQGYPNLPQLPFQTVTPNPNQRVDRYPFPGQTVGNDNSLLNQQTSQQYPPIPNFPFQTVQPGAQQPPVSNNLYPSLPRTELPKIRVIEFPASDYFEYGGGKLVQPKRPNSDLYVGGVGGDVPITSKIFVECTGPNQVEWSFNGTEKKDLSVVTKNFQITIPEQRVPTPGSGEYTYLRLGLEQQITEKDTGVYICRDRVLPQNYISIRILVAKPVSGKPNYPFVPKDANTIYFSRNDITVTLPCKIENADATISLHKHEGGKLSCPYTLDGRVLYDRFKGFVLNVRSFNDLEGRYVCVGDFNGELKLMKYRLVNSEGFTTRYVDGETQNVIALDGQKKSVGGVAAESSPFLAQVDPSGVLSGLTSRNLTADGFLDPRSEFESDDNASFFLPENIQSDNSTSSNISSNNTTPTTATDKRSGKL